MRSLRLAAMLCMAPLAAAAAHADDDAVQFAVEGRSVGIQPLQRRHLVAVMLQQVAKAQAQRGAGVGDHRWTTSYKREILESRVHSTRTAASAAARLGIPVLVNASAIGFYGDTGSAAIDGVKNCANVDIVILYPYGRTSDVQRKQMTTVDAPNAHAVAVEGTFDDCQDLVKAMFNDAPFRDRMRLSAVNSINWARVMAQTVYYVYATQQLGWRPTSFSVPTGNFGDIFAGYVAKKMGLPVRRLKIAAYDFGMKWNIMRRLSAVRSKQKTLQTHTANFFRVLKCEEQSCQCAFVWFHRKQILPMKCHSTCGNGVGRVPHQCVHKCRFTRTVRADHDHKRAVFDAQVHALQRAHLVRRPGVKRFPDVANLKHAPASSSSSFFRGTLEPPAPRRRRWQ